MAILRFILAALIAGGAVLAGGELRAQAPTGLVYSVQVGVGGARAWNLAGMNVEYFPRSEHLALFATAGFGTILGGGGVIYYADRPGRGLFASATAGLAGAHIQGGAQLPLSSRVSATLGVSYGAYFLQYVGLLPILALEYTL